MPPSHPNNISLKDAITVINALSREHLISLDERVRGIDTLMGERLWEPVVARMLLWGGLTFLLSGIVFFFAFNWQDLSPFAKFSLIQTGLIVCIGASLLKQVPRLFQNVLAMAGSVLVGVFLAVFGQVYQMGANSYLLFLGWAIAIVPWVFLYNFSPLWALLLILLNVAFNLAWHVHFDFSHANFVKLSLLHALFNTSILGVRELLARYRMNWLQEGWTRYVLLVICLLFLCASVIAEIIDRPYPPGLSSTLTLTLIFYGLFHLVGFLYYWYFSPNTPALGFLILSVCVVVETLFVRIIILDRLKESGDTGFLILALASMGLSVVGFFTFKKVSLVLKEKSHEN